MCEEKIEFQQEKQPVENSQAEGNKPSTEKTIAKILAVTRRKYGLE